MTVDSDGGPVIVPHFIPGWIQLKVRMATPGGDLINTFSCTPAVSGTRYDSGQLISLAEGFRVLWDTNAKAMLGQSIKMVDVTAEDLGDAFGQTGTAAWPANSYGTASGELLPANVALAVTARTRFRGPQFRGRTFLGGFTESATSGDNMTSAFMTAIAILIALADTYTGTVSAPVKMVVASRVHQLLTPIVSVVVTSIVDTMKRRLQGHGR